MKLFLVMLSSITMIYSMESSKRQESSYEELKYYRRQEAAMHSGVFHTNDPRAIDKSWEQRYDFESHWSRKRFSLDEIKKGIADECHFSDLEIMLKQYTGKFDALIQYALDYKEASNVGTLIDSVLEKNTSVDNELMEKCFEFALSQKHAFFILAACFRYAIEIRQGIFTQNYVINAIEKSFKQDHAYFINKLIQYTHDNSIKLSENDIDKIFSMAVSERWSDNRLLDLRTLFQYITEHQIVADFEKVKQCLRTYSNHRLTGLEVREYVGRVMPNHLEEIDHILEEIREAERLRMLANQAASRPAVLRPQITEFHTASTLNENVKEYLDVLKKSLEEEIKKNNIGILEVPKIQEVVKTCLTDCFTENSYMKALLETYAETSLSCPTSQKVMSYFAYLYKTYAENKELQKKLSFLFVDFLEENMLANTVNKWKIEEQNAFLSLLHKLSLDYFQCNPKHFRQSCEPGKESRLFELYGTLYQASHSKFTPYEKAEKYTSHVCDFFADIVLKAFDLNLFVQKSPYEDVDLIKRAALRYLAEILPQGTSQETKNSLNSLIDEKKIEEAMKLKNL